MDSLSGQSVSSITRCVGHYRYVSFTKKNLPRSQKAHQVTQFHITCWAPDGRCSNLKAVVDVTEEVAKVQRRTGSKPIFVHCR